MIEARMTSVASIKPYWRNPRNNDEAVGAVARSIRDYGFNSPILIDHDGVVISGHTRLKAAQLLGMESVPTVTVSLTEAKAREYRIADNKTAEFAEWHMADLVAELREVGDMAEFFPMLDVKRLLADTAGASDFHSPQQQEIDRAKDQMDSAYSERSDSTQERYSHVRCPSCSGEFYVDRNEAIREALRDEE